MINDFKFADRQFHNIQRSYNVSSATTLEIVDVVEVTPNILLAMSGAPTEFFWITISKPQHGETRAAYSVIDHIQGGGNGTKGLCLTLFPGFDYDNYPLVLVMEDTVISVWDVKNNSFM